MEHVTDDLIDLGEAVTIEQLARLAAGSARPTLGPTALGRIAVASARLEAIVAAGGVVYGATTGFGPLATTRLAADRGPLLQRHLIYHLASGVGEPLPVPVVRAIMAARLRALSSGWSAVTTGLLDALLGSLTHDVIPIVPAKGTVGASGDLTPLAHIALGLMGEGEAMRGGRRMAAAAALAEAGLAPFVPERRDALAMVNGVSAMTAIAALNAVAMDAAIDRALHLAVACGAVMDARFDAYHETFGLARPHPGLQRVLAVLAVLCGQARIGDEAAPQHAPATGLEHDAPLPQDAYTLRCVPQIIGAVTDAAAFHRGIVAVELNATSDNPIIDPRDGTLHHGGNFYGQHVAFAADALNNAVVKLAILAERQIARLTDPSRNGGLPAFLHGGALGENSGFMGAQVTATALLAEMRSLLVPISTLSISTNGDNQDVVSLGTIAARRSTELLAELTTLHAILALAVAQAADLRPPAAPWPPALQAIHGLVRRRHPQLGPDRPLSGEIMDMARVFAGDADWQVGSIVDHHRPPHSA